MDFVKNLSGGNSNTSADPSQQQQSSGGGIMGKVNSAMGGGQSGEHNEDMLDKGTIWIHSF